MELTGGGSGRKPGAAAGAPSLDPDTVEIGSISTAAVTRPPSSRTKASSSCRGDDLDARNAVAAGAAADQDTALSVGNSGSLSRPRPTSLQSGNRLWPATSGFSAGNIAERDAKPAANWISSPTPLPDQSDRRHGEEPQRSPWQRLPTIPFSPVVAKSVGALVDVDSSVILA